MWDDDTGTAKRTAMQGETGGGMALPPAIPNPLLFETISIRRENRNGECVGTLPARMRFTLSSNMHFSPCARISSTTRSRYHSPCGMRDCERCLSRSHHHTQQRSQRDVLLSTVRSTNPTMRATTFYGLRARCSDRHRSALSVSSRVYVVDERLGSGFPTQNFTRR